MTLQKKLKMLRLAYRMSLRDVAKASGVGFSTVSRLEEDEKADPKISTLQALARTYKTTVAHLIGEV